MTGRGLLASLCLGALLLAPASAGAPPVVRPAPALATSAAVQVSSPGIDPAAGAAAEAPPNSGAPSSPFAYPGDGSVATVQAIAALARTRAPNATAASEAVGVSLFGGEITAERIKATVRARGSEGDLGDTAVFGLVVFGQAVAPTPNQRIPLGDWGYAVVLDQSTDEGGGFHGTVTGLLVHLDADHGGLHAGAEIRIGYANAASRVEQTEQTQTRTTEEPPPPPPPQKGPTRFGSLPFHHPEPAQHPSDPKPQKDGKKTEKEPLVLPPPTVTPKLTAGGYVFPVYGPSAFGDTFGAGRADVSGGWHHGDDIFAPLGAPLLAVAAGTVFSVGWNNVGGYRLWLRDDDGNEFYYAHLSAYSTLAVDGARVEAGDVLGFVGNTGDAQGTPYHLHFEVHPVALLFLGYDGAVNPTQYLEAWRHAEDIEVHQAVGWTPPVAPESVAAPSPGAVLLESTDISTASGLDPASMREAMRMPKPEVGGGVGNLPVPLPVLDRA